MASAASSTNVQRMLTKNWSTLQYRIEYGGYFSNHLLHGVVALFELGASEEKLDEFAANYATKLEKEGPDHEDVLHPEVRSSLPQDKLLTFESARELRGKRENFDGLLALYATEIQELGIDGAVKKHLPLLVGGLAGALLHSIIQLGYAYRIGGERLVAEGLTYMHYAYLSFDEPSLDAEDELSEKKPLSREEALRLILSLKSHEFLLSEMRRQVKTKPLADLDIGDLQRRLSTMSGDPERGSRVAFQLIWDTVNGYDLSTMDGTFALDLVLWLYAMIEHNDFVILHAVTSAWALQQLEHLLKPADRVRAWKVWLHVALSAFVTAQIRDLRDSDICESCSDELPGLDSWSQIIARTLGMAEQGLLERDLVHVYKLVQVAHGHGADMTTPGGVNGKLFLSAEERDYITRKSALKVISVDFGSF